MAGFSTQTLVLVLLLSLLLLLLSPSYQTPSANYYNTTCPHVNTIVQKVVSEAMTCDHTIGAGILRLQFHDCFVMGCDASLLLDNTSSFRSEKEALPNLDSLRGFQVIDDIKSKLELKCPGVVSCADILTIAAQVSVSLAGGPSWKVKLGRKDSRVAYFQEANRVIPNPGSNFSSLLKSFEAVGLDLKDLIALSGAHTFGKAHCRLFKSRLYNFNNTGKPDPSINTTFLNTLRAQCPIHGQDSLVHLDGSCSKKCESKFNNNYYTNLVRGRGLLFTDQVLQTEGDQEARNLIHVYSRNSTAFFKDFAASMIKMGDILRTSEDKGEIRRVCRKVNAV